jgi:hypothetical protein
VELPVTVPTPRLIDPGTLFDTIEQMARTDARSGMYADAFLTSHGRPLVAEVRIAEQLRRAQREVAAHRRDSRVSGRPAIQKLLGGVHRESQISDGLRDDLAEAERAVDEQTAVLRGDQPGAAGGKWADSTALAYPKDPRQARRLDRWGSVAFYVVFGGAELYFSYLALLLLGGTQLHTWGMAAVVLGAVLFLPKQAGREIAFHRAVGGRRYLASATVLLSLLMVILVTLAAVRTRYVFRERTLSNGSTRESLAARTGLDPTQVTLLWLAVSVGIAVIVVAFSAIKTNPHRDAYRRALIRRDTLRAEAADHSAVLADINSWYDDRVRDAAETDALWAGFEAEYFEKLIPEAIAVYRHHLARAFASPDITTALEVSLPGPESHAEPATVPSPSWS